MSPLARRVTNIIASVLITVMSVNLSGAVGIYNAYATPTGNNGTLKVHEIGTPSGTESNDPKVCAFNFEGFSFDENQEGYIEVDTQPGGVSSLSPSYLPFGPTNGSGYAVTSDINNGGTYTLPNGHYKATLYGKDTGNPTLPDLTNEKAKSKVFKVDCTSPEEVTPTAPTYIEECGTESDSYTITATPGVIYKVNDVETSAGTYPGNGTFVITAAAADDYTLTGTSTWTFNFSDEACPPQLIDPVPVVEYKDVCTTEGDYYVIPDQEGVIYKVNGNTVITGTHYTTDSSVTITAEVTSGYIFPEDAQTTWTINFVNNHCPEPNLDATAVCSQTGVLVTVTNEGDADGTVYIGDGDNYVEIDVPAGDTATYTVPFTLFKATVLVYDQGENVLLEQDFDCTPGEGSIDPPVVIPPTKTPLTPAPSVPELPETGAHPLVQAFTLFITGITTYGIMFFIMNRRELRKK